MKITIDFELDDTMVEGQNREQLRQNLKKGLVEGLGAVVSDYTWGEDEYGILYAALKNGDAGAVPETQRLFNDFCDLLECEMATLEFVRGLSRASKTSIHRHETIIERGLTSARVSLEQGLKVPESCPRVADRLNS